MKKIVSLVIVSIFLLASVSVNYADVLFQDDFNDGNYDGWIHIVGAYGDFIPGAWTVTPEGYLQRSLPGAAQDLRLDGFILPESFILEFDTRTLLDGGGASLIAWYTHFTAWDNQLAHGYNVGRTYINETLPGGFSWTDTYGAPTGVAIDEWHHIKYVKDGSSVSLYFDDELIYSVTIPFPITGGHLVLTGALGTHQFDNVVISTPLTLEELESRVNELQAIIEQIEQSLRDCPTTKHCLPE